MLRTDWIKNPETEVEIFINKFMGMYKPEHQEEVRSMFRSGYCFHFASMIKAAFSRGKIVWCAPFGHIAFEDLDGKHYDIEGCCDKDNEFFYFIPEEYLGATLQDFMHTGNPHNTTREELINICKTYCTDKDLMYDSSIEKYFS